MNPRRKVDPPASGLRAFGFSHRLLKSSLQVKTNPDGVVIRTAESGLSPQARRFLLRYLAAEGFIPNAPHLASPESDEPLARITWITTELADPSGSDLSHGARRMA